MIQSREQVVFYLKVQPIGEQVPCKATGRKVVGRNNLPRSPGCLDKVGWALVPRRPITYTAIDPNIDRASTLPRAAYYVFIFCCLLIAARSHLRGNVFGSFLFAVFGWLIGSLGHDGGHFAVSRKPFVNDLSVWGISRSNSDAQTHSAGWAVVSPR